MLDSIYHMTLKVFLIRIFGVKNVRVFHMRDVKSLISINTSG